MPKGKLVTPETYFVGATAANFDELRRYLEDTDQMEFWDAMGSAQTEGLSDGEILISYYAKLCYAALTTKKNENISKVRNIHDNLIGVIASGHGSCWEHCYLNFTVTNCSRVFCYTPDAEIYTREGWRPVTTITPEHELLTRDMLTGQAGWERPQNVCSFDYEGEIMGWSTESMSTPGMTPDHTLVVANYDVRRARKLSCQENFQRYAEKLPFKDVFGKRFVIGKTVELGVPDYPSEVTLGTHSYVTADVMSWLGWVATDGGFSKDRPNQTTITQSKAENQPHIREVMNRLFGSRWRQHGPYAGNTNVAYTISDVNVADFARQHLGPDKINRRLSNWITEAPLPLVREFFDSAIKGDGTVHHENCHVALYCPSEVAADQFQFLGARLGQPANKRIDDRIGESHLLNGQDVVNTRVMYVVDFSRRGGASLIKGRHQWSRNYVGKVWCPKTVNGVVLVRGSGHPFWAGNTHELVRHRTDTSFSQTSGRYVRADRLDLVIDPILDPINVEIMDLQEDLEDWYAAAVERMGLNDPQMPFDKKKKITSALRRLLPNGQANEIGFGVNLRSLRNLIVLRTSRHAEWEIRLIFNQIRDLVRAKYPTLFEDEQLELIDGQLEVTFSTDKL